jgi:2-polyprenyl-6-methoxyphenol hydroxylase-like FAD-dependent oxidoreductase
MVFDPRIPLIAGAGPTGLAACLFLRTHGIESRIIDQAPQPALTSRALAVNPRTLDLLEPTGVTARMLERGLKIRGVHFYRNGKTLTTLTLENIPHRFPFLLAFSQAATERLLTEALRALGAQVERGVRLTDCSQGHDGITATLESPSGPQTLNPAWLFAADGAHSLVRQRLNLGFDGSGFPEAWHLLDMPLQNAPDENAAHITFYDDGCFLFLIRVVEDAHPGMTKPLWRLIGNFPNLPERLNIAKPDGPAVWESQFHISHRIASRLRAGNTYLGGDAAHIHSPMGARGMNLGIEDAWSFAGLMKAGTPERYGEIRHAIDEGVVKRIEAFTALVRGQSMLTRMIRNHLLPYATHIPLLSRQILRMGSGLDHALRL